MNVPKDWFSPIFPLPLPLLPNSHPNSSHPSQLRVLTIFTSHSFFSPLSFTQYRSISLSHSHSQYLSIFLSHHTFSVSLVLSSLSFKNTGSLSNSLPSSPISIRLSVYLSLLILSFSLFPSYFPFLSLPTDITSLHSFIRLYT